MFILAPGGISILLSFILNLCCSRSTAADRILNSFYSNPPDSNPSQISRVMFTRVHHFIMEHWTNMIYFFHHSLPNFDNFINTHIKSFQPLWISVDSIKVFIISVLFIIVIIFLFVTNRRGVICNAGCLVPGCWTLKQTILRLSDRNLAAELCTPLLSSDRIMIPQS